jgi:hypothetical protein
MLLSFVRHEDILSCFNLLYSCVLQVRDKLHEAGFYVEADISDRTLSKKVSLMTNLHSARVFLSLTGLILQAVILDLVEDSDIFCLVHGLYH